MRVLWDKTIGWLWEFVIEVWVVPPFFELVLGRFFCPMT
jgi:hypothetical protein